MPPATPTDDSTSVPLAAQIPLQAFTLPHFPPEASHLRELTLTSDIKLDEYQTLLRGGEYELPNAPPSITHLTLELFSLGFPGRNPKFLSNLAKCLPNLKALTLFACLIDGVDDSSRADAELFFELLPGLREVHIIDSFVRPGFWKKVGGMFAERARAEIGEGLKVVEVSYTYRGHEEEGFLARVLGEEVPELLVTGLVGLGFGFVEGREEELGEGVDKDDDRKVATGVLPFASDGRAAQAVKRKFERLSGGPLCGLKVLNLGMWTLKVHELGEVLYACAGGKEASLVDLTVSVLMEDGWWEGFVKACEEVGVGIALQGIEIIGVPAKAREEGEDWRTADGLIKETESIHRLAKACPKLEKFEMSILRAKATGNVLWIREDGDWKLQ